MTDDMLYYKQGKRYKPYGTIYALRDVLPVGTWLVQLSDRGDRMTRMHTPAPCAAETAIVAHEDRLIKVYMPAEGDRMDIFRAASRTGVQLRYFVKSQTSLEDLFAGVVGVD